VRPPIGPSQLVIISRPPSGLRDGSGRFIDGGRTGTAGSDGVAILSRGGASVEAVAAGDGDVLPATQVVDALIELWEMRTRRERDRDSEDPGQPSRPTRADSRIRSTSSRFDRLERNRSLRPRDPLPKTCHEAP
jgi:hypothetical protein